MKRILCVLLLLGAATLYGQPTSVHSRTVLIGTGHTGFPACASGPCDGTADSTTGIVDLSKFSGQVWVTVSCQTAPSTPCIGTVNVQQRSGLCPLTGSCPYVNPSWSTLISCSNPDQTAGVCLDGGSDLMYVVDVSELQIQQLNTGGGTFQVVLEQVSP